LDHVLGRLGDDRAARVEAATTGSPRDLFEVADAEDPDAVAVELAELGEQHRTDRHVDADAERVRPRDDLEQSLLREPLDERAVLRQQTRVVQADAVPQEPLDVLAVMGVEAKAARRVRERLLLLCGAEIVARELLPELGRLAL